MHYNAQLMQAVNVWQTFYEKSGDRIQSIIWGPQSIFSLTKTDGMT